jgi:Succinylglutamate desuccinylase / Aspartoacylase family
MLVVCGGVHGDEPSGAAALAPLAAEGITTCGPCNPWGLAHGRRELEDGRDLNRCFAREDCAEARRVRAFLVEHRPSLVLDLHEDRSADAPYIIQYGPDDDIGARIVARLSAMQHRFAACPRFGPVRGERGVLRPSRFWLGLVGMSRQWPLVYWAHRTFRITACVIEVPGAWSLERRMAMHAEIVRAAG